MTAGDGDAAGRAGVRRTDFRPRTERRVRSAWRGGAGPGLRLASAVFGLVADLRNLAYDAGVAGRRRCGVPVLSVGGLAVGGSGKTPVAAEAAGWIRSAGLRPAVVTGGFADEVAVHRSLGCEIVVGAEDRIRGARRAAGRGAEVVVLDDGFQHRRLARDVEWVVVARRRLAGGAWRRLPAGPARERWSELARADAVVVTRRESDSGVGSVPPGRARARIRRQFPGAAVAGCELRPGPVRPANDRAAEADRPRPRVAFASIMNGADFLDALSSRRPEIRREFLFSDHDPVSDDRLAEMLRAAGEGGMVGTRKDVVKVRDRVGGRTSLWVATESPSWSGDASDLERQAKGLGGRR